jgi:hypothetical protein
VHVLLGTRICPRASPTAFPNAARGARRAAQGRDQIKIMVSGGVASQADPLESLQFRIDEIEAAVEEATRWGTVSSARMRTRGRRDPARRQRRRATIEHWQSHRRADAPADGGQGRVLVPTLVAYDCAAPARCRLRAVGVQLAEERDRADCRD